MNNERKNVDLGLSLEPERGQIISKVQKEIIEEDLKNLDPLKENDINISTTYVFDMGDKLEASIFLEMDFQIRLILMN
ncbi:SLAP domain-containing protein [Clostridium botulinum]|nr:SLAP domain-containing protein [Clostridium botulinum]